MVNYSGVYGGRYEVQVGELERREWTLPVREIRGRLLANYD